MAFPSLSQLFSSTPTPAAAPAPQAPNGMQVPPAKNPPGTEPAFQANQSTNPTPQNPTEAASPLDEYKDLFNIDTKEGEDVYDPNAPFFSADPTKLAEMSSKQNFVDPATMSELAQKATGGDHQALMQLINNVSQQAFQKAADFSIEVGNRTARSAMDRGTKELPNRVRDLLSRDNLASLNPAFSHAGAKPLVNAVRQQIEQKYPEATPQEIAKMTNNYLTQFASTLTQPAAQTAQQQQQAKEEDWDTFFELK